MVLVSNNTKDIVADLKDAQLVLTGLSVSINILHIFTPPQAQWIYSCFHVFVLNSDSIIMLQQNSRLIRLSRHLILK